MKVALLYTGFLRTAYNNFDNHKKLIFEGYNPDVYVSTWDTQENDEVINESNLYIFGGNLKNVSINSVEDYIKNEKRYFNPIDRDGDVFKVDDRAYNANLPYGGPQYWVDRLMDQWYNVKKGMSLINGDYDIVIRLRFDLIFNTFVIDNFNGITVPFSPAEHQGLQIFNDHMAYGDLNLMRQYSNLWDHMHNIYIEHNFDISYAEKVLKFYLENYVTMEINRTGNINYNILK